MQNATRFFHDDVRGPTMKGETRRRPRVPDTRGSAHDTRVREVEIRAAGLRIL